MERQAQPNAVADLALGEDRMKKKPEDDPEMPERLLDEAAFDRLCRFLEANSECIDRLQGGDVPEPKHPIRLAQIRARKPCADGWGKLQSGLGLSPTGYDPAIRVTLGDVAAICGPADAWWCVRALPWPDAKAAVARCLAQCVERAAGYAAAAPDDDDADEANDWASWAAVEYANSGACRTALNAARHAAACAAAAVDAARAAAAYAAERERQVEDIIAVFGRLHAPRAGEGG